MTPDGFRKLALSFPGAIEGEHMDHPDFRVRGKIFATIHPDPTWAVVLLTPDQQKGFLRENPDVFLQVKGGWGRKGGTLVVLKAAKPQTVRPALTLAWRNRAGDEPPLLRRLK